MRTGRPREFDTDKALDRAMRAFWQKGYEGTSLPDLTRAMGINRPSLYAAFGNKEQLFRRVLDRYAETAQTSDPLGAPTAKLAAIHVLQATVDTLTCAKNPRGCLLIQGALACSKSADPIRKELILRRRQQERALSKRFVRGIADGDLRADANPTDLARFIATVSAGLSIQAANGATRDELLKVTTVAMQAWPD